MIDKFIGQSISQLGQNSPVKKGIRPAEEDSPSFMDTLRATFESATNNLEKKELPGSEAAVYIPKPQTLDSLNITDLTDKPLV
jgi:hypothetical protein